MQLTVELPAKSRACESLGEKPLDVVGFGTAEEATAALTRGDVAAVSADSPAGAYAVAGSGGALEPVGDVFDTHPYAVAVAKGSALGPVLARAFQHLIDTGEMATIAARWGLRGDVINRSVVNADVQ